LHLRAPALLPKLPRRQPEFSQDFFSGAARLSATLSATLTARLQAVSAAVVDTAGLEPIPADLVELGFLRGAFGLLGWVHVQPHSGDAAVLRGTRRWWLLPPDTQPAAPRRALVVSGVRTQGAALVAKWEGCSDPETAQSLKGWRVGVARADFPRLPAGQYYWVDLVGMAVHNRQAEVLGVVAEVRSNGAHDLLEVRRAPAPGAPEGSRDTVFLIPVVAAYVDDIDLPGGRILVDWDAQW